ncbi:MAG: hypothetical protein ACI4AA_02640 [Lachnospiraceae bacterium]
MAKKVRNILLLGAAIGAAAAGTYYYLQKKDNEFFDDEDDDADDFDAFEDDDDLATVSDSKPQRNYVPLHFDASAVDNTEEDTAPEKNVTLDDMNSVEEFFDDEDDEVEDETPIEEE